MKMPRFVMLATALAACCALPAAASAQQSYGPPGTAAAIPLFPAGSLPAGAVPESCGSMPPATGCSFVRNVSAPTLTPVLPDPAKATGAAVVVAPGGAFMGLAIGYEGFDVARWLADRGIAAFVLKYRLIPTPADEKAFGAMIGRIMQGPANGDHPPEIRDPQATEDGLRALAMVRQQAATWRIDPARVGMIGFSAGAMATLQTVLTGKPEQRPAFFGYIYGPMTPVAVPAGAPPMFVAYALDDPLFGRQGFGIVDAWRNAGRPVELHSFEHGGHGFGMGKAGTTSTLVMDEFRLWLDTNGFLTGGNLVQRPG